METAAYHFKDLAPAVHYELLRRGLLDESAQQIGEQVEHYYNLRAKYYSSAVNWDYQREMEEDGCIPYTLSVYVARFPGERPRFIDHQTTTSDHKLCGRVVGIRVYVYVGQNDLQ